MGDFKRCASLLGGLNGIVDYSGILKRTMRYSQLIYWRKSTAVFYGVILKLAFSPRYDTTIKGEKRE